MHSQRYPFTRQLFMLGVALAFTANFIVGIPPAPAVASPRCDRAAIVNARLDQLGRNGYTWLVGNTPADAWGIAKPTRVMVSELVPCDLSLITSVVNHEWMHTQQLRMHPRHVVQTYGDSVETVADCGSLLLGSRYTPYLDQRAQATCRAVVGCTAFELGAARELLKAAGR